MHLTADSHCVSLKVHSYLINSSILAYFYFSDSDTLLLMNGWHEDLPWLLLLLLDHDLYCIVCNKQLHCKLKTSHFINYRFTINLKCIFPERLSSTCRRYDVGSSQCSLPTEIKCICFIMWNKNQNESKHSLLGKIVDPPLVLTLVSPHSGLFKQVFRMCIWPLFEILCINHEV